MAKKYKMDTPEKGGGPSVDIVGLDLIYAAGMDAERTIGKYERFAEHVILSCNMPEVPRMVLADEDIVGTPIEDGYDAITRLLVRYRKITAWLRANRIDVNDVCGETPQMNKKKN